jgi:sulfotransferase
MTLNLHFLSDLPRSGSTLLAAVLRQNPRFEAGFSSPMAGIYLGLQEAVSARSESAVLIDDAARLRLLRGAFEAFYAEVAQGRTVFDSHRLWCAKLPGLARLYPRARIVASVRHVPWVMDSFERLIRRNAFDLSGIFGYERANTVYGRLEALSKEAGTVGFAWNGLKEAFYGEEADRLILVRYESLTTKPGDTLRRLYELLGEPWFEHDFANVAFASEEFDRRLGTPGLHTVRARVAAQERQSVLPPDLFRRYESDSFWEDAAANPRGVVVL